MTQLESDVKQFMQKFGQKCPDKPTMPDLANRKLRCKLILEETLEFVRACGLAVTHRDSDGQETAIDELLIDGPFSDCEPPNLPAYADATADLRVVVIGSDIAAGIQSTPIDAIVSQSNLSKLWSPDEVESISPDSGLTARYADPHRDPAQGFIVTDQSGKVIKSPSYLEATPLIAAELERQQATDLMRIVPRKRKCNLPE